MTVASALIVIRGVDSVLTSKKPPTRIELNVAPPIHVFEPRINGSIAEVFEGVKEWVK
jgi:hypothetical protein